MALPLYLGMGETWRPVEKVFGCLLEHLPDNYIVVDQTLSGAGVRFASGPEDYVEYGALVLGPGIAGQIQVTPYGDLLEFEELKSSKARIAYLDEYGELEDREVRERGSYDSALDLADVVQWIVQAEEEHDPEVRAFFSKLKVVETTVAAYATSEWDEAAALHLGFERLHTGQSVVEWLQQLEESVIFSDCEWTEDEVRTLLDALGGPLTDGEWDWSWDKLSDAREAISKRVETLSEGHLVELISSRYPFPLAFSFRRFETEAGYPEKLRCAENVLAYVGSLGVALAQDAGLSLSSDEGLGSHLKSRWTGGISSGDWVRIIRETTRALHTAEMKSSVPDFPYVYWKRSRGQHKERLGKMLEEISQKQNDFHHHRYPTSTSEYPRAAAELREVLMPLYEGLRFLEAYPLWYVSDCAKQRGTPLWKVTYKLCVGDNAQFKRLEAEVGKCLFRDSVYLRTPERLVDLTPWIVLRTCPRCGSRAMFFVEKMDRGKQLITYKSFNRGHAEETHDHWDLISSQVAV